MGAIDTSTRRIGGGRDEGLTLVDDHDEIILSPAQRREAAAWLRETIGPVDSGSIEQALENYYDGGVLHFAIDTSELIEPELLAS